MLEQFGLWVNVIALSVAVLVLDRASDLTINNAVKLEQLSGSGKTTIGFIFVAFCTSLPALSVSILSASVGSIGVAVGNALGSNIVNICLILGICLLLPTLKRSGNIMAASPTAKEETRSLYFGVFIGSTIPLFLMYIGYASRLIGVLLLGVFVVYTYRLTKLKGKGGNETGALSMQKPGRYFNLVLLSAVAVVVVVSYIIVDSASYIALSLGMSSLVIGGTVVALGTSIPVLMASLKAIRMKHVDMALGNIVGTCFMNTTLILGASLVISSVRVDVGGFSGLVVFSAIANLFLWYFLSSSRVGSKEGAVLLFMYILFLAMTLSGYKS